MHPFDLRLPVRACLIASAVSLASCDAPDAPTATLQLALSAPAAARGEQPSGRHQGEDHFDELATRFPGFAGFYVRGSDLVVMGTDTAVAGRAGTAIAQLLASSRVARPIAVASRVTVRRADFTYRELAEWRDLAIDSLLVRGSGVTLIDVDETINRLTLGVAPEAYTADSTRLVKNLLAWGVRLAALRVVQSAPDRLLNGSRAAGALTLPATLYGTDRPWYAGLATVTAGNSCTGGMVADYGTTRVLITASHCTDQNRQAGGGSDGTAIFDGGQYAEQIATELLDPAAFSCTADGSPYTNCRRSDIALATITLPSWNTRRGAIARPSVMNSCSWGQDPLLSCNRQVDQAYPFFTVTGHNSSIYNGMAVEKVGKATGWTSGTVQFTCVYRVADTPGTGQQMVNTCGHRATAFVSQGDSGGPWFTRSGSDGSVTFIGISSAGSNADQLAQFTTLASFATDAGISASSINVASDIVLSGIQITGDVGPRITWTPGALSSYSPYPTEYAVYRKYNAGDGGESLVVRTTTTSALEYSDDECVAVQSYAGTTPPPANVAWVGYFVAANNTRATAASSGTVYYRLSEPPGC